MKKPIRVLHVLGGLTLGGAESRIMDLYRNVDRGEIQFDFLVHSSGEEYFDKEVEALGGNVYRIPCFKLYNWFSYKKAWKLFFKEHQEFKAVHGHMTSTAAIYLPIAKKAGVSVVIGHARSAGVDEGLKGLVTKLIRIPLKYRADYCLACSREAGEAVYGKRWMERGRVEVIPNAIEAQKYAYDEAVRTSVRKELGIEGKLLIGHVGNFRMAKNHSFLIRVFAEICKKRRNAALLLVGEGPLMETVKKQVVKAGLEQMVFFMGSKADVSSYYQAMDYLVFPSFFEGLPGAVIEAQTAGLRCLVSDTVTKEVGVTELVNFFSLKRTAEEWAEYVVQHCTYERISNLESIRKAGFDIQAQIVRYKEIYGVWKDGAGYAR